MSSTAMTNVDPVSTVTQACGREIKDMRNATESHAFGANYRITRPVLMLRLDALRIEKLSVHIAAYTPSSLYVVSELGVLTVQNRNWRGRNRLQIRTTVCQWIIL